MKNIKFLFLLVATLFATAFTACQQEWEPGQPDSELSVYFPVDVNVAAFATVDSDDTVELDETTTAVFPVYRQKAGTEMTVEIRSRAVNPTAVVYYELDENDQPTLIVRAEEAFIISESVTFEEDSIVAYLEINLNKKIKNGAKSLFVGDMHDIEILVKDAAHQGHYGLSRKVFSVGVPETWTNLGDAQEDPELKLGSYTEDFFVWAYGVEAGNMVRVAIEESDARKGVYRIKNLFSQDNIVQLLGGIPTDMTFASGDTYIEINAEDPEKVFFEYQPVGFGITGFVDSIYIATLLDGEGKLEDGVITFPQNGLVLCDATTPLYYANQEGKMRITLPGVSVKDHSFALAYTGTQTSVDNSETRAYFEFYPGADVEKYRFLVVEGNVPAYEEIKEGQGLNQTIKLVMNEDLKKVIEAKVDADGKDQDGLYLEVEVEGAEKPEIVYLDNCAESSVDDTTWYFTLPNSGIYTIFAVPFDANGKPVMEDENKVKCVREHFYYSLSNADHVVPELAEVKFYLDTPVNIAGETYNNKPTAEYFPSSFVMGYVIECADADLISNMVMYYEKSAEIPTDKTPEELLYKEGADLSSLLTEMLKDPNGKGWNLFSVEQDTEYTAYLSVTDIYGQTQIKTATFKSDKYSFDVVVGTYEMQCGNSKLTVELVPFFNSNEYAKTGCGELYYMNFILEDEFKDAEKFPYVAFREPKYNAIITYGQVNGYQGSLFAKDLGYYGDTKDSVWGFESSSQSFEYPMHYNNEAMVLYYDKDSGVVTSLDTYFRQYIKTTTEVTTEVTDPETGEKEFVTETDVKTTYPVSFIPTTEVGGTTITFVENKEPVVDSDDNAGDEQDPNEEENTGNEPAPSKMGKCRSNNQPAVRQIKRDMSFAAVREVRVR